MNTPNETGTQLRIQLGLLLPDELAALLDVELSTIERWRREGTGPDWTRLGQRVYYTHQALRVWVHTNMMRDKFSVMDAGSAADPQTADPTDYTHISEWR